MADAIQSEDVRKTYDGGVQALKGVSLSIEEGDFFALLGPNGAGKTTLIGILTSLVNKSSGEGSISLMRTSTRTPTRQKPISAWCRRSSTSIFSKR
jgi:ABC-type multidrug transport system ATPase subunit